MKKRGVYILQGDNKMYVGSTGDITRRMNEHKRGETRTTKNMGKFILVRRIPCEDENEARLLEKRIKRGGHYERRVKE